MELNLHQIATKCFVSGRDFQENDRVISYLVREASGEVVRRDLLASEDPPSQLGDDGEPGGRALILQSEVTEPSGRDPVEPAPWAFVYCRWITDYKVRREDDAAKTLKLTAENLFLTLAFPSGSDASDSADDSRLTADSTSLNTPLLQFLALMLERKKVIKLRGITEDRVRQIYEHMPSHQLYEVPVGDLNEEFFRKIQDHLGVLVGTKDQKTTPSQESLQSTDPLVN